MDTEAGVRGFSPTNTCVRANDSNPKARTLLVIPKEVQSLSMGWGVGNGRGTGRGVQGSWELQLKKRVEAEKWVISTAWTAREIRPQM